MLTSNFHAIRRSALLGLVIIPLGCNQPDPPGTTTDGTEGDGDGDSGDGDGSPGDGDGDGDGEDYSGTLYPLADGAEWVYISKTTSGQVLGMEEVHMQEIVYAGQQAFFQTDSPNANGVWDESVLTRDGTVVYRVHREGMDANGTFEIVEYDPGFARADDGWDMVGFSEEFLYDRTWTDGAGLNPSVEARGHQFTVLALDEQVTVPAGTFDCVKVERVRTVGTAAGERVLFWFAWGVGKVREERPADLTVEELASVSIPGGTVLP